MIEKYARAVELSAHRIERLKRQNAVQKIVIVILALAVAALACICSVGAVSVPQESAPKICTAERAVTMIPPADIPRTKRKRGGAYGCCYP